jgi:hypothetical protein
VALSVVVFSKKWENLQAALALQFAYYSLVPRASEPDRDDACDVGWVVLIWCVCTCCSVGLINESVYLRSKRQLCGSSAACTVANIGFIGLQAGLSIPMPYEFMLNLPPQPPVVIAPVPNTRPWAE